MKKTKLNESIIEEDVADNSIVDEEADEYGDEEDASDVDEDKMDVDGDEDKMDVDGDEDKMDEDKEREFYERALIDFYRYKHPSPVDFIHYVCEMFRNENYEIKDSMSSISKDAKCCMINYLSVFDVCRLAMTCKTYKEIVDNVKYNEYWRTRFRLKFPISYVEKNGIYKYRGKSKEMLWFDIYQYSVFYNSLGNFDHKKRKQLMLNKQSLNTFVKAKRHTFPGVCKLNVYFQNDWKLKECLKKEFEFAIPADIVSLLQLSTNMWTAQKFEKIWIEFCTSNFLKIKTQDDLIKYKKTLNPNGYYHRKGCLFDIPDDFKTKWNLQMKAYSCLCPYDNQIYSISTVEEIKKRASECPKYDLRGSIFFDPLRIECRKYGLN
jgi:hypothetical protein